MTRLSGPSLRGPDVVTPFENTVVLSCTAQVGDQEIESRMSVPRVVWEDPAARTVIEESLRFKLVMEILKKWTPVVKAEIL